LNVPHPAPLLPWLDLSRLDGRAIDHLDFLADLREAAHDVGFFYLTGHYSKAVRGNSRRRPQIF
jgi:isopenicillin N synthase-like dioxygenase